MNKYYIWILVASGFLLYSRILFNGFVGDDVGYINHQYIQHFQILKFFQSGSADLGGASLITGSFFRPLMLVVISFIYQLSGHQAFLYHFVQLSIHIGNTVILFLIFKKFLKEEVAFILALIFLAHPINVETVTYISNLQDVLFVCFGLLGFLILIKGFFGKYNVIVANSLLLLSMLSKETGVLFILVYGCWVFLYNKKFIKLFLASLLLSVIPYFLIRFFIANVFFGSDTHTVFGNLPLTARLLNIPAIVFHYLYIFIFPKDLLLGQTWITTKDFNGLYLPIITLVCGIASLYSFYKKTQSKKTIITPFIFFVLWFISGLAMHIQILPLEMTVADRWFYFPIIGLLGIIGVVTSRMNKQQSKFLLSASLVVVIFLGMRSFVRMGDFKNSLILYSHDSKYTKSYLLEHSLGYELMLKKEYKSAYPHLISSITLFENTNNTNTLGVWYYQTEATKSAIIMFEKSIALGGNFLAYRNAAQIYIDNKDYKNAERILLKAVVLFPQDSNFWFLLAIAEYKLGKVEKALGAAERLYQVNPNQQNVYIVNQLRIGEPIKFNN